MAFFGLPGVALEPLKDMPLTTNLFYVPLPKKAGLPGLLFDQIEMGAFNASWNVRASPREVASALNIQL